MSKENCRGIKCDYCLNDSACCCGEYQPLIDESFCNTCINVTIAGDDKVWPMVAPGAAIDTCFSEDDM